MSATLTERRRFWRDHLTACRNQGSTLKAYAEQHQLSRAQLYHWSAKLRRLGLVEELAPSKQEPPPLIPVRIRQENPAGEHCRIELPDGIRLSWPIAGDARQLTRILQALESRP